MYSVKIHWSYYLVKRAELNIIYESKNLFYREIDFLNGPYCSLFERAIWGEVNHEKCHVWPETVGTCWNAWVSETWEPWCKVMSQSALTCKLWKLFMSSIILIIGKWCSRRFCNKSLICHISLHNGRQSCLSYTVCLQNIASVHTPYSDYLARVLTAAVKLGMPMSSIHGHHPMLPTLKILEAFCSSFWTCVSEQLDHCDTGGHTWATLMRACRSHVRVQVLST